MCNLNIHDRNILCGCYLTFCNSQDEVSNKVTHESKKVVIF